MEFGNQLKNLLYLNDCVIIPGLGGFVARYYPAKIDGLRRKVKPPSKEFFFDDTLVKDGDILISFLARIRGIEQAEARAYIDRFASDTKIIVMQGNRAELPGLGWFFKGPKGRIQFEFDVVNNFHPETAGLPELNLPDFNKSEKPVMTVSLESPDTVKRKSSGLRHMAWIIPLLILILAAGFAYLKWDTVKKVPFVATVLEKIKTTPGLEDEASPRILLGIPDSATAVERAIDTTSSMKNALTPGQAGTGTSVVDKYAHCTRFYIIAGSFKRIRNAQVLSNELSKKGFKTEILTSSDGMYRVSVMLFTNRNQALIAFEKMKSEGKLKGIWLLSI